MRIYDDLKGKSILPDIEAEYDVTTVENNAFFQWVNDKFAGTYNFHIKQIFFAKDKGTYTNVNGPTLPHLKAYMTEYYPIGDISSYLQKGDGGNPWPV